MEDFETKQTGSMGEDVRSEGERLGRRVADKIGGAAGVAGEKLDAAVDYVDNTTKVVKDTMNQIRDEGWEGMKKRTLEYTRNEPLYALLIAVSTGMMLGWLTKRR
jgi:ElaB/YqjD/DUF883 family membrane-anchored ribosome-binding protein